MDAIIFSKGYKKKCVIFFLAMMFFLTFISIKFPNPTYIAIPSPRKHPSLCPVNVSEESITPVLNTQHFMVSAFLDQRVAGQDIRIISIFKLDSIKPLHCLFCCAGHLNTTSANVRPHPEHFGYPFVTTAVMCRLPPKCRATHLTLLTEAGKRNLAAPSNYTWIPIRNQESDLPEEKKLNFTVCISSLFGNYNNVLQFAQTMEMYRLLGVNRVIIYRFSCTQAFERLLQSYSQQGFLEIVPWPIDKYLNPSTGWLRKVSGGDLHYYGQMTTLNECVYRSMVQSRYVLLNDMDEIIMPYQHNDLMSLMNTLQPQHPNTGVFRIENHVFPKKRFEPSGRFHLPQWDGVPGINILEHIYREEPIRTGYHPSKLIIRPRMVEQTSVHEVLKYSGQTIWVPPNVCRIIHIREALQEKLKLEELHEDKRLWDFHEKLISNVDKVLGEIGLLNNKSHQ